LASCVERHLYELDFLAGVGAHLQQQQAGPHMLDVGTPIVTFGITHGHIHDVEIQLGGAKKQIEITEWIKVTEERPPSSDPVVIAPPEGFSPTECVFDGLVEQIAEGAAKHF